MRYLFVTLVLTLPYQSSASEWEQVNSANEKVECPNFIIFAEHKYRMLNDCYGDNPSDPIMETGDFEKNENSLTLINRNVKVDDLLTHRKDIQFELIRTSDFIQLRNSEYSYYFNVRIE
jgi:hypothetical protein